MLMDKYFEEMKKVLVKIEDTQKEKIIKISEEIADRLAYNGYRSYAYV